MGPIANSIAHVKAPCQTRDSLVREALVAHEAAEVASVGDQASDANAHVVVNLEQLPLELAQLCGSSLHGRQHHMRLALVSDSALLSSSPLHCQNKRLNWHVFPSCSPRDRRSHSTLRPTTADPCFTASIAYSIWCILPCGLHVTTSWSYCSVQPTVMCQADGVRLYSQRALSDNSATVYVIMQRTGYQMLQGLYRKQPLHLAHLVPEHSCWSALVRADGTFQKQLPTAVRCWQCAHHPRGLLERQEQK